MGFGWARGLDWGVLWLFGCGIRGSGTVCLHSERGCILFFCFFFAFVALFLFKMLLFSPVSHDPYWIMVWLID